MAKDTYSLMIMAAGTGGHVFPALAIAEQLQVQGHAIYWLATPEGLEQDLVAKAGFTCYSISARGFRRQGVVNSLIALCLAVLAFFQALFFLIKIRPRWVLGMGGYVSLPGGLAAWLLRIPLVIHEQNAVLGLSNRLLAPLACVRMSAFPRVFPEHYSAKVVGNPVRRMVMQMESPEARFAARAEAWKQGDPLRLLVLGGSRGAQPINTIVPKAIAAMPVAQRPQIRHQAGQQHCAFTQAIYQDLKVDAEVVGFLEDMAQAYGWADLVICRAGAMTVSELATAGVPSLLIPYPYAVDNHQLANANYLAGPGAAVLLEQSVLDAEHLLALLMRYKEHPWELVEMAKAAYKLEHGSALRNILRAIKPITEE